MRKITIFPGETLEKTFKRGFRKERHNVCASHTDAFQEGLVPLKVVPSHSSCMVKKKVWCWPRILFRQCVAEELPFADCSVDLVTAMSAFHWFDRARFLQEAHRVLKPRGCLALLNYTIDMELSFPYCSLQELNQICKEVLPEFITTSTLFWTFCQKMQKFLLDLQSRFIVILIRSAESHWAKRERKSEKLQLFIKSIEYEAGICRRPATNIMLFPEDVPESIGNILDIPNFDFQNFGTRRASRFPQNTQKSPFSN